MFKLISFIGTGNYEETTYRLNGQEVYTRYFPVVAAAITRPDQVAVAKTTEATEKHWQDLKQELLEKGYPEPVGLDIPSGRSKDELWEIFNTLVAAVQEGDTVAFDITHSFRSLPLISFLSVAYLKYVKNVNIKALYYGAYDARDKENNITPVFDLTGFCSLLDWIVGVNSFVNHGAARELGGLLVKAQQEAKAEQGPGRRELNNFGGLLKDISRALFANRPFEVMDKTRKLNKYREGTYERDLLERDVREWAAPFGLLLDNVVSRFSKFSGIPDNFDPANLERHLEIARWYVDHNYAPQALSMMRELAISAEMYKDGHHENVFSRDCREKAALRLHREGNTTRAGKLWSELGDLRNDVIHCGWREGGARSSARVMNKTRECLRLLEELLGSYRAAERHTSCERPETSGKEVELAKVLVTPLGISPGLLYTALLQINPDRAIVLTSAQGKLQLETILQKAAFEGDVKVLEVEDPFAAYHETPRVEQLLVHSLEQLPRCHLYINLTGGTTLLQYMISRLNEISPENCSRVTTVAMVDRRSPEEQRQQPYVVGEMIIVDKGA